MIAGSDFSAKPNEMGEQPLRDCVCVCVCMDVFYANNIHLIQISRTLPVILGRYFVRALVLVSS